MEEERAERKDARKLLAEISMEDKKILLAFLYTLEEVEPNTEHWHESARRE